MDIKHDFVTGLLSKTYVSHDMHSFLHEDSWKDEGPNIGSQGENLTISFLSLNRAALSIKLINSIEQCIPQFAGELLVIDNGSEAKELLLLYECLKKKSFCWRIVELQKNYGVAGGRNRAIPHVKTEWLMCLDNDIYFITNPLSQVQKDLSVLGCHFMSLPLLNPDKKTIFARGGHLYLSAEGGELHIGAGSVCKQGEPTIAQAEGFLSSFLFGGACLFKCETFNRVGGYDEAMFVGFEDLDFSIRLFQQGYKVGSTAVLALVHDHPLPTTRQDKDYERERFSRDVLKKSAFHMEAKHGFKIWSDAVDHWLVSRQRELGLEDPSVTPLRVAVDTENKKTKIALIIDTDNWAFGNIARQLQRYLADKFDFVVIPMDVVDNIDQIFLMTSDCDVIHFFWREHLTLIGTPYYRGYVEKLGMNYDKFYERFIKNKLLSTSIYDHLLLKESELAERTRLYTGVIAGYTVASEKLNAIYSMVDDYPQPLAVVEDGVDLSLFQPKNLSRLEQVENRELVIGWVGNSKWASEIEDFKGLVSLLKPALKQLQNEGYAVKGFFADRQERFIPHAEMSDYYSQIDIYVCSSKIEGTPNPVLEAMACGVPIISTDVGIVPQAFGKLQQQFILPERSVKAIKLAIRRLIEEPKLLLQLSAENLRQIQAWDWSLQAAKFGQYFDQLLSSRNTD